jgi:glycerol-3-phosphate dehydrogenase
MRREEQISSLEKHAAQLWDVIIIGGGATGAGLALDASSRGFKTLLLEKGDFSHGTSSRSTKLVHGGVRYLAQGDLLLVIEALRERGIMLKNAPHLTSDQQFIIPVYTWFDMLMYTVGLTFYDLLAGRLSLGRSYFIGRKKTIERLPNLNGNGLKGGVVYHDGQFDDARMTLDIIRKACESGCTSLNYFTVNSLTKDNKGKVSGVNAVDVLSGRQYDISAKCVINATGVFANDIIRMDEPQAQPILRPSQGIHLVLDSSFLGSGSAIMIPKTTDGRVLFAIPWYGKVVVGTTDTPLQEISSEPKALEKEIAFILETAGKYLIRSPQRKDVLSVFAGLRPLASDPSDPHSTKEISRRHKIIVSPSHLITITGGKWTTYRRMASETLDRAIHEKLLDKKKCHTADLPLDDFTGSFLLPHFKIYGRFSGEIEKLAEGKPELLRQVHPWLPYTVAEIIWICSNEMAVTIEDILARRTRSLFLDSRSSVEAAPAIARIMAAELGHDEKWKEEQVTSFNKLAENYMIAETNQ